MGQTRNLVITAAFLVGIPYFAAAQPGSSVPQQAVLNKYCVTCHNTKLKTGGLSLQDADLNDIPGRAETWEKVIRKLRTGSMPPQGAPRPDAATLKDLASFVETSLDHAAAEKLNPGRATMHRLNRTEYANAIRDLLALDIDATALLPPDDESSGFDNIADVLGMSPSLMERYLSASWNISREAVGNMNIAPATATYRVRPDLSQDQHIEGLPLGTRGGILVRHYFPLDAEYVIKLRLWRNTFDLMRGMEDAHQIEISVDGKQVRAITAGGKDDFVKMAQNPGEFGAELDKKLTVRLPLKAGPHSIAAATILRSHAEKDDLIKPFLRTTIDGLDITGDPSVDRLTVEGPLNPTGPGETPSRKKIFICTPANQKEELSCARKILALLLRRAYRRPLNDRDFETPLSFYQRRRNGNGSFEAGIEAALQFILASPEFLFRFEPDPSNVAPGTVYQISDVALASRLSFFLWSSPPDDELLNLASQGKLHEHAVLEQQVKRMLLDERANALVDNFAEQWLFLRNLKNAAPDPQIFPDFDDNLRQAMREETKLFFQSIVREDRSVTDLLNADYTFVNERLARHYGIPNVYGSQFRRVTLNSNERRGLLGQGSILTVTSYANRTSPVQRGKWILTNLLGIPPTPPPPNVPTLKENSADGKPLSLRERMEQHRSDAVCAGCHKVMDPIGFALENFDAVGQWRTTDDGAHIDPSGMLYDGTKVDGPAALRAMLTKYQDVFIGVTTEKLLTYALGRGVQYYDMPAVRKIVRDAGARDFRFSALVLGITESVPFQMKMKPAGAPEISGASASLHIDPAGVKPGSTRSRRVEMRLITKKHLSRRTVLRGLGTAISLPLLDSMVPAQTPLVKTAANPQIRLGLCFIPHGAVMANWTPAGEGTDLKLSRILTPLEPFKNQVVVVTNLAHKMAAPGGPGDNGGDHTRSPAVFLNGVHPKRTDGADIQAGTTIDQIAAQKIGQQTPLPSLELATEDFSGLVGSCDVGFSCAYMNTISWRTPTTPLPMEINPRVVFTRLFGDGANAEERMQRIEQQRSILDAVMGQMRHLETALGPTDRNRVSEYLDTVREIERRIQLAEKQNANSTQAVPDSPTGIPDDHQEHSKLMFDLMAVAFQANITSISTFMMAREVSYRTFPMLGISEGFHPASHHQNNPERLENLTKINTYHVGLMAYFLGKLKATPDGDGNLLDHSLILYGSGMSNSNVHNHAPLPVLVAGGAAGRMKGGRHLKYPEGTPMANLLVSILDKAGVPQDRVGDSTGPLTDL